MIPKLRNTELDLNPWQDMANKMVEQIMMKQPGWVKQTLQAM